MANIVNVNYEAIPAQAKQMRNLGIDLNSEVTKAYASLAQMHDSWYGTRYNELVMAFNNIIPQLNEILTLVVTEIPYALETVANNYSQADKGTKVTTAVQEPANRINNIQVTNDVGMKFVTESVTETQQRIVTNLRNAKEQMNKIDAQCGQIEWQSEAATAFKSQFTTLKNEIVASFDNIETQFTKLMTQTLQDIQATESANTVQ